MTVHERGMAAENGDVTFTWDQRRDVRTGVLGVSNPCSGDSDRSL